MTINNLLDISKSWPELMAKFYINYKKYNTDISFGRLLNTLINQLDQYSEYFKENTNKLNLDIDFGTKLNESFNFEILEGDLSISENLSKQDFLKKAIYFHEISIHNCSILQKLSNTDSSRQIFKELSDEEYRYLMILKDRLALEELY